MTAQEPVNIIIGSKNPHCPSKMPHRYNVGHTDIVTGIWSEHVQGKKVTRTRLQKINLQEPSWFAAHDSPLPPAERDYVTKAQSQTCTSCESSCSQIYLAGWMCLNEHCKQYFRIDGEICTELTYNPVWFNERTEWPAHRVPPFFLKPEPPLAEARGTGLEEETSVAAWKGMVCPKCGRCNSRTKWDKWRCFNESCDFELPIMHTVFDARSLVEKHGFEFEGQAISFDTFAAPVTKRETEWPAFWRQSTYDIPVGVSSPTSTQTRPSTGSQGVRTRFSRPCRKRSWGWRGSRWGIRPLMVCRWSDTLP